MADDLQPYYTALRNADKAGDAAGAAKLAAYIKSRSGAQPAAPAAKEQSFLDPEAWKRAAGLTARTGVALLGGAVTGMADIASMPARYVAGKLKEPGTQLPETMSATFEKGLTEMGLPEPRKGGENITYTLGQLSPIGVAALPKAAKAASSLVKTAKGFSAAHKGEKSAKAGEAARAGVMGLAEGELSKQAAKQGELPGAYETLSEPPKPIGGRDVPSDMVKDVQGRARDYEAAYTTWRNTLKDEWQQISRGRAAAGEAFQAQPETKKFISQLDSMAAKYKHDKSVSSAIKSFREMVLGKEGSTPSFDAIETAQQKLRAAAAHPENASVPNLVTDFGKLSDSLNSAMASYSPKYGEMLKSWPAVMERKEALQRLEGFASKYAAELEKISPTSQANPRDTLQAGRSIAVKLKTDGIIDDAAKEQIIAQIDDAVAKYGETDAAKKAASKAVGYAMTAGASAIGLGSAGWWLYQGGRK